LDDGFSSDTNEKPESIWGENANVDGTFGNQNPNVKRHEIEGSLVS